jgi:ABC-type lipoprotein export system ATPase subunit
MTAIEVRDLFRVHSTAEGDSAALQGLSLTVADRELLVVLGPSGSGKTSLLRVLAGFDRPSAGAVHVFGRDIAKLAEHDLADYRATALGYADQHYTRVLTPQLSARRIVGLQLRLGGSARVDWERRADELLEQVGLTDRRHAFPAELSGGEQQRVALCAALAHKPRLFLADEPTGELDAGSAALVYDAIGSLVRTNQCTAVVVSHDPHSESIADRIVHIRDGRVTDELITRSDTRSLVVDDNGWVRLPEELRERAGIGARVRASFRNGGILIASAGAASAPTPAVAEPAAKRRADGAGEVVVEAHAVVKRYGTQVALHGVDAVLRRGRMYALTGRSGSGKTTLLRLLAGFGDPDSGEIVIAGQTLQALDHAARAELRRTRIAFVTQQPALLEFLTVEENVALGLEVRRLPVTGVGPTIEAVGLTPRAQQRVARLSAGEQARAAIARALASAPDLLLADEPTARLDQANAAAVAALLARVAAEHGTAIVCATHDPVVIAQADVEIALEGG